MESDMKLKIREKRREKGITQAALAHAVGVTQGAVVQWENGSSFPKFVLIPKIAKALGCTVDDLIGKSA